MEIKKRWRSGPFGQHHLFFMRESYVPESEAKIETMLTTIRNYYKSDIL
jgi:hypothetical protein